MRRNSRLGILAAVALGLPLIFAGAGAASAAQQAGTGRGGVFLLNSSGAALDVNGTRLRAQAEAAGNGNSPQDVRADAWGDGVSNGIQQVMAYAAGAAWNGSGFDRLRTTSADGGSKTGVLEVAPAPGGYHELNAAATTAIKATGGILYKIVVNTPAAETVTVYDVASGSCTGTPGSGQLANITLTTSTPPGTLSYGLKTANGICIKTSSTADITVVFE